MSDTLENTVHFWPPITPVPDLKCIAWDPNDSSAAEARTYIGDTPRDIATKHAEWMYRQGDPQEEYNVRVQATRDGVVQEWDVIVYVVMEVSFAASPAYPVELSVLPTVSGT